MCILATLYVLKHWTEAMPGSQRLSHALQTKRWKLRCCHFPVSSTAWRFFQCSMSAWCIDWTYWTVIKGYWQIKVFTVKFQRYSYGNSARELRCCQGWNEPTLQASIILLHLASGPTRCPAVRKSSFAWLRRILRAMRPQRAADWFVTLCRSRGDAMCMSCMLRASSFWADRLLKIPLRREPSAWPGLGKPWYPLGNCW